MFSNQSCYFSFMTSYLIFSPQCSWFECKLQIFFAEFLFIHAVFHKLCSEDSYYLLIWWAVAWWFIRKDKTDVLPRMTSDCFKGDMRPFSLVRGDGTIPLTTTAPISSQPPAFYLFDLLVWASLRNTKTVLIKQEKMPLPFVLYRLCNFDIFT